LPVEPTVCAQPVAKDAASTTSAAGVTVIHPTAQIREQQRRPVWLPHDEPTREAVECRDVGSIESVKRAKDIERRGGRLDLRIDGD